jgi:hypothetical protein
MFHVYIFTLVLGGVILLASIILGGKDNGADKSFDKGFDKGFDKSFDKPDSVVDAADHQGTLEGLLTAFLSMRFWTFGLTFFGLTGAVLDGILEGPWLTALLAFVMGMLAGQIAVAVLRNLANSETSTAASERDYVGKTARVLVGFGPGQTGKLRLTLKGTMVDVLATDRRAAPLRARRRRLDHPHERHDRRGRPPHRAG